MPCGVIGNTTDSGSVISGSNPDGATNFKFNCREVGKIRHC